VTGHNNGMTITALMEEFGLSSPRIYDILAEANVKVKDTNNTLSQEQLNQLAIDYTAGMKVQEIIAKYALSSCTAFYTILSNNNIPLRQYNKVNQAAKKIQLDLAIDMYLEGYKLKDIKDETGIYQAVLHNEMRKRDIPLRKDKNNNE